MKFILNVSVLLLSAAVCSPSALAMRPDDGLPRGEDDATPPTTTTDARDALPKWEGDASLTASLHSKGKEVWRTLQVDKGGEVSPIDGLMALIAPKKGATTALDDKTICNIFAEAKRNLESELNGACVSLFFKMIPVFDTFRKGITLNREIDIALGEPWVKAAGTIYAVHEIYQTEKKGEAVDKIGIRELSYGEQQFLLEWMGNVDGLLPDDKASAEASRKPPESNPFVHPRTLYPEEEWKDAIEGDKNKELKTLLNKLLSIAEKDPKRVNDVSSTYSRHYAVMKFYLGFMTSENYELAKKIVGLVDSASKIIKKEPKEMKKVDAAPSDAGEEA